MSTPMAIASTNPMGSPTPMRYLGASAGSSGTVRGEGLEHLGAALAHRKAADPIAVEADGDRALGALSPETAVDTALHDAE